MTSWAELAASWLVILAAGLAVDRAMVSRAHRPVAAALCMAMLEPARPDIGNAGRLLCLCLPALSAWLTVRVLARSHLLAACAGALVLACGSRHWEGWAEAPRAAAIAAAGLQALAILVVVPRRALWLSDRCVIALAAGDVAALLGPMGAQAPAPVQQASWWVVQWQAAAVALVLCGLHVAQALADRRRDAAAA